MKDGGKMGKKMERVNLLLRANFKFKESGEMG